MRASACSCRLRDPRPDRFAEDVQNLVVYMDESVLVLDVLEVARD
jgi:hypothetical protein